MNEDFDTHGPSKNCEMVKKDECKFEACNVKLNGPRKCVGGALALFVYKVYKIRKRVFFKKTSLPGNAKHVPKMLLSVVTSIDYRLFTVLYFSVRSKMSMTEFDGPPSWSLDASETGETTKCPGIGAMGLTQRSTGTMSRKIGDCELSILTKMSKFNW